MYIQYKWGLKSSRKPEDIYQGRLKIGEIQRTYKNSFFYWIDTVVLGGHWFISYRIDDEKVHRKFESKDITPFFKRTQFNVNYRSSDSEQHEFILKQLKGVGVTRFEFNYRDKKYLIEKNAFQPAEITYNGLLVAECKVSITDRTATIQIYDSSFKEDAILLVGIYHSVFFVQRGQAQ